MIKLSCVISEIIIKTTICILLILIHTHGYTFVLHSIEIEQFISNLIDYRALMIDFGCKLIS